jgi:hypothetical protein
MQDGRLAEPDQEFRIASHCGKINPICNPVGSFPAPRDNQSSNPGIGECFVNVAQPIFVPTGEVAKLVEDVATQPDPKPKAFEKFDTPRHVIIFRRARRRNQSDQVSLPQQFRHPHLWRHFFL